MLSTFASDQAPDCLSLGLISMCKSRAIVISIYNLKAHFIRLNYCQRRGSINVGV